MAEYAALWDQSRRTGGKVFFVDEAHFRASAVTHAVVIGEAIVDDAAPDTGKLKPGHLSKFIAVLWSRSVPQIPLKSLVTPGTRHPDFTYHLR